MKDYSELKMLADAAILGSLEEGDNFRIKCRPSVIRGLFDDIERLGSRLCMCRDCGGQGEVYSGHSTHQGYNQPPEPDMDVCGTCGGDGVLGPVEDFEAITTERDQLKAEAEVLRKDAERYRWLRDNDFDIGSFHPAHEHNHQSWFEYFDDESIDYNLSMQSK